MSVYPKTHNRLIGFVCLLFIFFLILFPSRSFYAAGRGIDIWLNAVLPALLPFFIGAELLINLGIISFFSVMLEPLMKFLFNVPGCSSFVFIMSITSGYPMGVKMISDLRKRQEITRIQGERMLSFCNTSGPLFMIGAVAVGMLNAPKLGIIIALSHYTACLLTGLIFRFYCYNQIDENTQLNRINSKATFKQLPLKKRESNIPFGTLMGDAVRNSINTLLLIGGFIILFSVIIEILLTTNIVKWIADILYLVTSTWGIDKSLYSGFIYGLIEITIGSKAISIIPNIPTHHQIMLISMIIAWGGLSVHFQAASFLSKTDLRLYPYIIAKIIQSVLAGLSSLLYLKLINKFENISIFSSNNQSFNSLNTYTWTETFSNSFVFFVISIIILSIISIITYILKKPI